MPAVSVVIPCYNQGQYLAEAVASVNAQTFTDWEIVVVDDGSTDPTTQRLLTAFTHPRARLVRSANGGLAAARNLGISHAAGRFILPLDCDDRIAPTYDLLNRVMTLRVDQLWRRRAVATLRLAPGERLLDVTARPRTLPARTSWSSARSWASMEVCSASLAGSR